LTCGLRVSSAVPEAKEYADRGEFIEEAGMDKRFDEMVRS